MRITGLHVDGFGLLHDQQVEGVPAGTTVVLGPNEAGKSTLHAFLVRTLFGHPRRNDAEDRNRHEPLRGGRHGGVVHCEDETGARWQIHRYTEGTPRLRVVAPDGSESTSDDALLELLGRTVDESRYEQVFAIDLDALAGVGSLGGGELDDLLFDAATVGTGRSLRAARDEAVARRDELWTPASTKRPLAAAIRERSDARAALAAARDAARDHVDLRRRLDEATARVEELAGLQQEQAARVALLERVRDAWPAWSQLRDVEERLQDLPAEELDASALERARAAARTLTEAEDAHGDLVHEREVLLASIEEADEDPAALAVADRVEALADRLSVHELAVEQLGAAEQARDEARRRRAAALGDLGDGWDEDRVRAITADTPTRHRLEAAAEEYTEALRRSDDAADRAAEAERTASRRREQVAERRREVPETPDEERLAAAEEALAVLRSGVPTLERAAALREAADRHPDEDALPPWVGGLVLGIAVVGAVATALGAVPGAAGVAVTAVLAAAGAFLVGRTHLGAPTDLLDPPSTTPADLEQQVARAATVVGLDQRPSSADVERVATRIAAARDQARHAAEARRRVAAAQEEAADATAHAADLGSVAEARRAALDEARKRWEHLCDEVGLDHGEDVRVVLARHERVTTAQQVLEALATATATVDEHRDRVEDYRADVAAVLERVGETVDSQVAVRRLPALRERVRAARVTEREQHQRRDRLADLDARLASAASRVDEARTALHEALVAAGADDLDALEAAADRAAHRAGLVEERDRARREVGRLLGEGPRGEDGRALLRTADPTAWEEQLAAAHEAVATLRGERDRALAERTELEADLRRLGGDDAVPRAEQRLAAAEVEVGELAERWAVADTAARLLEETVARFEREQQPRVLQRASSLFARATGGEWAQVRRLDEQVVVARSEGGDPVPAGVLSRGTREQLWLCLRLALAEDLSEDRPLPLLVDDLLGTSDPERSLHVARVLAEVARHQQVWLFTCHPRTAELVTSTDPTAGVLRLRRGKVTGLRRNAGDADVELALQLEL